jgi:PAS domain S-box-containing protein
MFGMMPIQAGFLDTAGVLEFANLKSLRDFNMTFDELAAPTRSGIIHVDDLPVNHEGVTSLRTTGKWLDGELRFLYPDGTYRWTRARVFPWRDAQGNVVRYVTCQIDVDDLKRAEALLAAEVKLLGMVARGEPLSQVLGALSHHVEELCSGCFCSVLIVAPDRKHFQIGARSNLPDAWYDLFDGKTIDSSCNPCSRSVVEKTPIITADLAHDPGWKSSPWLAVMNSLGIGSCCAMPVISVSGEVSGVVAVHRSAPVPQSLKDHEEDLLDRFTKLAGIAIDRAEADAALQARERELREAWGSSLRASGSARPPASPRTSAWIGIAGRTSSTASSRSIRTRRLASTRSAPEFMRTTCSSSTRR